MMDEMVNVIGRTSEATVWDSENFIWMSEHF